MSRVKPIYYFQKKNLFIPIDRHIKFRDYQHHSIKIYALRPRRRKERPKVGANKHKNENIKGATVLGVTRRRCPDGRE